MRFVVRAALVVAAAIALTAPAATAQTHMLVVVGLGGEARHDDAFHEWATSLVASAKERFNVPAANIRYLAGSPKYAAEAQGRSTREAVERALTEMAARAEPDAVIFIVLIGHGGDVGEPRLNLTGPDLTAGDLAIWLTRFGTQTIAVVNTASASGEWLQALSGERRIIITATRSSSERYETVFGRYFAQAFTADDADTDKNSRLSLLEAFEYARREVVRTYESDDKMLSEHALIDDDGDKKGSVEPSSEGDGVVAARIFLDHGPTRAFTLEGAANDPALAALVTKRDSLEREIAQLRTRRSSMETAAYEQQLERMLLELAVTTRQIRERGPR
ncbi:MAG: hypothetical protein HY701_06815 [Gemmatimonadetes bacterium]|nr:hypothetical protein [Gemmatimonadota bacterium]